MAMTLLSAPKIGSVPPMINMMSVATRGVSMTNAMQNHVRVSYSYQKQKNISSSDIANMIG